MERRQRREADHSHYAQQGSDAFAVALVELINARGGSVLLGDLGGPVGKDPRILRLARPVAPNFNEGWLSRFICSRPDMFSMELLVHGQFLIRPTAALARRKEQPASCPAVNATPELPLVEAIVGVIERKGGDVSMTELGNELRNDKRLALLLDETLPARKEGWLGALIKRHPDRFLRVSAGGDQWRVRLLLPAATASVNPSTEE